MSELFKREGMLLGEHALIQLENSHVAVFGLGGVGSWCAEALARAGVGELTLIDSDDFSKTNINRQLGALADTVGKPKVQVMAERIRAINPEAIVHPVCGLYSAGQREAFFGKYHFVADCIDLVSCKLDLIAACKEKQIPIISALGTGNKLDAARLEITDISKTMNDPLARVIRKELRERDIRHLTVVYSAELPTEAEQSEAPPPGRRSVPGSVVWVPATAGLLMAQHIVTELIK